MKKKGPGKCEHCGCELAPFLKKNGWLGGCKAYRMSVAAGACPSCYRIYLEPEDMTKHFFKCPKCGEKGEATHFFPGQMYGDEYGVVCPRCTKPGDKPVWCKQILRL